MKDRVENGLLGQVIFIIIILSVMIVFSTLERYPFANTQLKQFFIQQDGLLCLVLIELICSYKGVFQFSNISVK